MPGKQRLGYISKNLFKFPCFEIAVPHPPGGCAMVSVPAVSEDSPSVNDLLILIQASGYPIRSALTDQTSKVIPSLIEPVPPRQNCSKGFFSKLSVSGTVPVYASISPASTCSFI